MRACINMLQHAYGSKQTTCGIGSSFQVYVKFPTVSLGGRALLTTEPFCWPLVLWDDRASNTPWSWGVRITDVSYLTLLPLPFLPAVFGGWKPDLLRPFPFCMVFWSGLGRKYFGCEWSYILGGWEAQFCCLCLTVQAGSELSILPSDEMHYRDCLQCGNETSWSHTTPLYFAENRQPLTCLL